jgi:endonuclease/exonuclease/phosphatase family metal-dependent hydrolase
VLYDGSVFTMQGSALHDDTIVAPKMKPVLEVRLGSRDGDVQIFVVHLMWGSAGRELRARQLDALAGLLERERRRDARAVVMGDFNATEDDDRADLARIADATGMQWATEGLACSAFWDRDDGCATSRLDHVLSSEVPSGVEAGGACADGCELRDRCPAWVGEVSDHCPVTVTLP